LRLIGFADGGELIERGLEQTLLHHAINGRNQNDEAGMQRVRRIEMPEIAGIISDEDEIAVPCAAQDIPVLPARATDMRDMPGFMAGLPGGNDQVDAEAFVDQKSHNTPMEQASGGCGVPAADRTTAACAVGRDAGRRRHEPAPAGSSLP
jgi:hypothetical protein